MSVNLPRDRGREEPLAAFAELSKIMLGEKSLDETLGQIAALARDTVPDIDEVSVTLVDRERQRPWSSPASWLCTSTNGSTNTVLARAWTQL